MNGWPFDKLRANGKINRQSKKADLLAVGEITVHKKSGRSAEAEGSLEERPTTGR